MVEGVVVGGNGANSCIGSMASPPIYDTPALGGGGQDKSFQGKYRNIEFSLFFMTMET